MRICARSCAQRALLYGIHFFATIYLSRYMFILNWVFDVLPITFDENFMLCSLAESMKYD